MTPTLLSLLAVTIGFTALVLWVYWPSRKSHVEAFGRIPLADDATTPASQEEPTK